MKNEEITINGKVYIPKDSVSGKQAKSLKGMKYVIVRTYSAGVFAGYLESRKGREVVLLNARRLWYWDGAASLSQLAEEGVSKPENCKFPQEVARVELLEVVEILDVTQRAKESIDSVAQWKQ